MGYICTLCCRCRVLAVWHVYTVAYLPLNLYICTIILSAYNCYYSYNNIYKDRVTSCTERDLICAIYEFNMSVEMLDYNNSRGSPNSTNNIVSAFRPFSLLAKESKLSEFIHFHMIFLFRSECTRLRWHKFKMFATKKLWLVKSFHWSYQQVLFWWKNCM